MFRFVTTFCYFSQNSPCLAYLLLNSVSKKKKHGFYLLSMIKREEGQKWQFKIWQYQYISTDLGCPPPPYENAGSAPNLRTVVKQIIILIRLWKEIESKFTVNLLI